MDIQGWKELGLQALTGAIYGAAAAAAVTNELDKALLMAVLVGAVKGAAHSVMKLLAPKQVNAGRKFKSVHWTEKADRIL